MNGINNSANRKKMIKVNKVIVENFYEMIDEFNQIKDHLSLSLGKIVEKNRVVFTRVK